MNYFEIAKLRAIFKMKWKSQNGFDYDSWLVAMDAREKEGKCEVEKTG